MKKYIFDVDGTLTPSRGTIQPGFKEFFRQFCIDNEVYIVTGSDRTKTIEQIGPTIYALCKRVYQCSGNDVWEGDVNTKTNIMEIPEAMYDMMYLYLEQSKFSIRTGCHIDTRPGLVNFSIIGRGCDREQRAEYVEWDRKHSEREFMAENMRAIFPEYDIQVAGDTGLDITLKGKEKSQILEDFDLKNDQLYFFGDKMEPGGNDYSLGFALATRGHDIKQVKGWEDTWEVLKSLP